MKGLIRYIYELKLGKVILWCYFIWYVVIVYFYFDSSPKIWIDSVGISAIIGTGLILSVASKASKQDHWQIFRLYFMPFCVSSFSALVKEQGFIVFVPPKIQEATVAISCCILFLLAVAAIKLTVKRVI